MSRRVRPLAVPLFALAGCSGSSIAVSSSAQATGGPAVVGGPRCEGDLAWTHQESGRGLYDVEAPAHWEVVRDPDSDDITMTGLAGGASVEINGHAGAAPDEVARARADLDANLPSVSSWETHSRGDTEVSEATYATEDGVSMIRILARGDAVVYTTIDIRRELDAPCASVVARVLASVDWVDRNAG